MNLPLFLLIAAIPSIVGLKYIQVPQDFTLLPGYEWDYDIFTWWKSLAIFTLVPLALLTMELSREAGDYLKSQPLILTTLFIVLTIFSTLFSHSPVLSMFGMPQYAEGGLVFIGYALIFLMATQIHREWVRPTILASILGVMSLCLLQVIQGHSWLNFFMGRNIQAEAWPLYASLQNPNHLGLFLSLTFPFVLGDRRQGSWWLILGGMTFMVIGSASRLALVSISLSSTILIGQTKRWVLLIPLAALLIGSSLVEHHKVYKDRLYIWKNAIPLIKHTLLIGHGPASFINEFPQTAPGYAEYQGDKLVDRPHNIYFQIAHGTGILSLLILGFIVLISLSEPAPIEYKASIIGFLIAGFFTDSFIGVTPVFCFLLGACWAKSNEE